MKGPGSKIGPEAVKKLMVIGEMQGSISLKDLSLKMGLSPEDTLVFLREFFPSGSGLEIYNNEHECMVDIDASTLEYMLPVSPAEWISLNHVLENLTVGELQKFPALGTLQKKVLENDPIKAVMELLNQLEAWDLQLSEKQQGLMQKLDHAVQNQTIIGLTTTQGKSYQVFPCRIIHLEGKLSMIAEDVNDHCLVVVPLNELEDTWTIQGTSLSRVSLFEVDEFIAAIRSMGENETRLILKIHDPQSVNLFPDHHFLGKPCMITNPNGDLIWAAYVEPCDDLFEWLIGLKSNVEILDPTKFKDEFLIYCEEKLRKVA
jgi:hypothetical protein